MTYTLDAIADAASHIIENYPVSHVFCFEGEMGAGKTTLIEAICQYLGVQESMSSPTYSIIQEYAARELLIVHADLYRLKSLEEAMDIGFEEYFDRADYCFIEWYQVAETLIPTAYYLLQIAMIDDKTREIHIRLIER